MKNLTWLMLLLGILSLSSGSSRAWAQSGITAQNGRNVTVLPMTEAPSVPGRYQPRGADDKSA